MAEPDMVSERNSAVQKDHQLFNLSDGPGGRSVGQRPQAAVWGQRRDMDPLTGPSLGASLCSFD